MIRILIVEDNAFVRKGLTELLSTQADIEVAGVAANGQEALELLEDGLQADVILTDLQMPHIDGLELTKRVNQQTYPIHVIILTMHLHSTFLNKALAAGVKGYLLKGENFDDLFNGIRKVISGEVYVSPGLCTDTAF